MRLESSIERAVVDASPFPLIKLASPSGRGWPDRVAILPHGRALWIEFKRPGGKLSSSQKRVHARLASRGHEVRVFYDSKTALDFLWWQYRACGFACEV